MARSEMPAGVPERSPMPGVRRRSSVPDMSGILFMSKGIPLVRNRVLPSSMPGAHK